MSSINEYLLQLQSLTKTNLEILQALNNSFSSKQNRLAVNINGSTYSIPSFISLENKVNALQANFENLVHAPETGEAYFNFDGDSRAIEVRGYNHVPYHIILDNVKQYNVEQNDIFKDFLTPCPYINFSLGELPNDITTVNIKKIVPLSDDLKNIFKKYIDGGASTQVDYSSIHKIIDVYDDNIDYIEYDTIKKLPLRKNVGTGIYAIETIISDEVDVDLDEYIKLKIRTDLSGVNNKLTYKLFDDTIEKTLQPGDELVTFDNSAKLIVTEVNTIENILTVKVAHGEYLNLAESHNYSMVSDSCKLRFFAPAEFGEYKYVNVPLEEDRYVFIAIAPVNDRMNVQGSWGTGVMLDVDSLKNSAGVNFRQYYDNNVKNIGDVLYEISSMMSNTLTKYSKNEFDRFTKAVPSIDTSVLKVTQINNHINNSSTIQTIRTLYSSKKADQQELNRIQQQIQDVNRAIASIPLDDINGQRENYNAILSDYNSQKIELIKRITTASEGIAVAANDSVVPIEAAKYHIRGFFDPVKFSNSVDIEVKHICGIKVQYRYRNSESTQGSALSFSDEKNGDNTFVFSDWNVMTSFENPKIAKYESNYVFESQEYNGKTGDPSYNQIDIPISQGEVVEIRLKVLYDFGRPFVEVTSDWSSIAMVEFPVELTRDVQILDIIKENNSDIETNRFNKMIEDSGIIQHIESGILDQNSKFYHKADDIASGFLTSEQKVISLSNKLQEMDSLLNSMYDEMHGVNSVTPTVSIEHNGSLNILKPYQDNYVGLDAYSEIASNSNTMNGVYTVTKNGVVSTVINISIKNNSDHVMKIYPMFPGQRDKYLHELKYSVFDASEYQLQYRIEGNNGGGDNPSRTGNVCAVWMRYLQNYNTENSAKYTGEGSSSGTNNNTVQYTPQTCNQIITFRICDKYDGTEYNKLHEKLSGSTNSGTNNEANQHPGGDSNPNTNTSISTGSSTSSIIWFPKGSHVPSIPEEEKDELYNKETSQDLRIPTSANNSNHDEYIKTRYLAMYPAIKDKYSLCIDSDETKVYYELRPTSEVIIPVLVEYYLDEDVNEVTKTLSFDMRTSLYQEPLNYTFNVTAKYEDSTQDKVIRSNRKNTGVNGVANWSKYQTVEIK
jgi:hypothetical protein